MITLRRHMLLFRRLRRRLPLPPLDGHFAIFRHARRAAMLIMPATLRCFFDITLPATPYAATLIRRQLFSLIQSLMLYVAFITLQRQDTQCAYAITMFFAALIYATLRLRHTLR